MIENIRNEVKLGDSQQPLDMIDGQAALWQEYFLGKSSNATTFVRKNLKKTSSDLSPAAIEEIAAAVVKERRVNRLVGLLQVLVIEKGQYAKDVLRVAEVTLGQIDGMLLPAPDEDDTGSHLLLWRKKHSGALTKDQLEILLSALLFGWITDRISDENVGLILTKALSKSAQEEREVLSSLQSLLCLPARKEIMIAALHQHRIGERNSIKLSARLKQLATGIERLELTLSEKTDRINTLDALIVERDLKISACESLIAESERKNTQIHNKYNHMLDQTKSRVRGLLGGAVKTWLVTSLEAIRATPPRVAVAEQRLEDALAAMEKECECLQHLD